MCVLECIKYDPPDRKRGRPKPVRTFIGVFVTPADAHQWMTEVAVGKLNFDDVIIHAMKSFTEFMP
jgi:hypothetical protein